MKYQLVGEIAGTENATVTATVVYLSDYRDPEGQAPPPVLLFRKLPGQSWAAQPNGGSPYVWGPGLPSDPSARVRVTYTVLRAGLPPQSRVVERRIYPNTSPAGYWDFTIPDSQQPLWNGGGGPVTPVEVLPGQGPQGERGNGWHSGSGDPLPALGVNGDLYLNTLTWDVWVRELGGWIVRGNIKGAAGGTGAKGDAGRGVPAHTANELGMVLTADNSPSGASWRAIVSLLSQLIDVDMSIAPTDGQALVWNAAVGKWKPGNISSGPTINDPFVGSPDPEGFESINAESTADAEGFQTITNGTVIDETDGFQTVERSTP